MTGAELRAIRQKLGLSQPAWGRALGYEGTSRTIAIRISGMESEARTITEQVARLAEMFGRHGVPKRYLAD